MTGAGTRVAAPADADVVELTTVGIDVGSATYHLSISRVRLERRAQALSSRFDVVARHTLAASPVRLTPYRDDNDTIDVDAVAATVRRCYEDAGTDPAAIDSGVVLLTGTALARRNARALAEQLAGSSGRFVCAAAGHHFEAVLAAHGSGAVARSAAGHPVVAMDIGGATTKLALCVDGEIRATAALVAGGRLLAWDDERRLTRVEAAVVPLARRLGLAPVVGQPIDPGDAATLCDHLARAVVAQLHHGHQGHGDRGDRDAQDPVAALAASLALTDPLPLPEEPFVLVASGGVSEYLGDEPADSDELAEGDEPSVGGGPSVGDDPSRGEHPPLDSRAVGTEGSGGPGGPRDAHASGGPRDAHASGDPRDAHASGDLGPALAAAVAHHLRASGLAARLAPAEQPIRATVLGASQFSTQVSGSTVRIGDQDALPLHHVPVVRPALDLGRTVDAAQVAAAVRQALIDRLDALDGLADPRAMAVAVAWKGAPEHRRLSALAEGIWTGAAGVLDGRLLVVAVDRDLAATLGRLMVEEAGADDRSVLALDALDLADLDHLDVGRPTPPAGVVPVVVKSLLFGTAGRAPAAARPTRHDPGPTGAPPQGGATR